MKVSDTFCCVYRIGLLCVVMFIACFVLFVLKKLRSLEIVIIFRSLMTKHYLRYDVINP